MNKTMKILWQGIWIYVIFLSCVAPKIYKNFSDYKEKSEIAIVIAEGYVLRIRDGEPQKFYDKLYLLEGKYLIEFKDRITRIKGAALCELKANHYYTIEVIDKKDFPKYKKSLYIGRCKEISEEESKNLLEKYLLEKELQNQS